MILTEELEQEEDSPILLSERMSCDQRSLQLSLISFKERVTSQQKRIEDLETENRELRARVQANQTAVSHMFGSATTSKQSHCRYLFASLISEARYLECLCFQVQAPHFMVRSH